VTLSCIGQLTGQIRGQGKSGGRFRERRRDSGGRKGEVSSVPVHHVVYRIGRSNMRSAFRKPKAVEQFLIREFVCDALHYTISRPEWCESPDAILTLRKGRAKMRVAIEHTGYFNDTTAGQCSPLTPISDFWERVQISLVRRISHRKQLADVMGTVQLNTGRFASQIDSRTQEEMARHLAKEIVEFLDVHPITGSARFPAHSGDSPGTEFGNSGGEFRAGIPGTHN